jgi:subtilisin family serine protease
VYDIEYTWNRNHEDLSRNFPPVTGNQNPNGGTIDTDHGTSVAGIIKAEKNGFGVDGIAPNVTFRAFSQYIQLPNIPLNNTFYTAIAIFYAAAEANPGDVILLEVQRTWYPLDWQPMLPIEWWPQDFGELYQYKPEIPTRWC